MKTQKELSIIFELASHALNYLSKDEDKNISLSFDPQYIKVEYTDGTQVSIHDIKVEFFLNNRFIVGLDENYIERILPVSNIEKISCESYSVNQVGWVITMKK